jgi:hypothetical protein
VHAHALSLEDGDLEIGSWDLPGRQFTPLPGENDPFRVNALRVRARLDAEGANGPVPAFLSRVLGRRSFDVRTEAVAYLGFAGSAPPGTIDLPIVIDCCKLRGADCNQDYCASTETPPNACSLELNPQAHDTPDSVSCLEFHPTGEQNACWTEFGHDSSVDTNEMTEIVESGVHFELAVGEEYYLDNGTKKPVIDAIDDRFRGQGEWAGGNGAGVDRYAPLDGEADSWVVRLPVVECQTGVHCATGTESAIVGLVCFEIREVHVTPDKEIRGRFLCAERNPELFEDCAMGGSRPGGPDYSVRADLPVLVR